MRERILSLDILSLYSHISKASYATHRIMHDSRRIAKHFYHMSDRWTGGADKFGRKRKDVWPRVAEFMLRHRLDPETCTSVLFASIHNTDGQAYPYDLYNKSHLEMFKESCRASANNLAARLNTEKAACRNSITKAELAGLDKRSACAMVLSDNYAPLSPLFRLCLAYSEGLHEIWPEYLAGAVTQFLASAKAYKVAWGHWLPEGFADACEEARRRAIDSWRESSDAVRSRRSRRRSS